MKYAVGVEYAGSAYCGWQRQPHCASIQQHLEAALGFVAFGEVPDRWTWIGGGLIVGRTAYIGWREAMLARAGRLIAPPLPAAPAGESASPVADDGGGGPERR